MRRLLIGALGLVLLAPAGAQAAAPLAHRVVAVGGTTAHVLTVPAGATVVPVARRPGRTVPEWARASGAIAAINGGYFNHSDGHPVSHVVADGRALTDPRRNRALTANPVLKPVLGRIFDARTEWRALEGPAGCVWSFAPHRAPVPAGFRLRHALQAGPALLPKLDLAGEAFVLLDARGRVVRDGIGASGRAARSAIGLTPTGELLFVAVAGSPKARTGVTIPQLAGLMRTLGASAAMALDGGSSTTLSWREGTAWKSFTGSGAAPARVNSALLVLPSARSDR